MFAQSSERIVCEENQRSNGYCMPSIIRPKLTIFSGLSRDFVKNLPNRPKI
jgi:hypothetical protein